MTKLNDTEKTAISSNGLLCDVWQTGTMKWSEYPIGTKAKALMGGYWIKNERGWKWCNNGGTFPTPGGDATGEVCLPNIASDEYLRSF